MTERKQCTTRVDLSPETSAQKRDDVPSEINIYLDDLEFAKLRIAIGTQ